MYLMLLIIGFVIVGYVVLIRSWHFIINVLFSQGNLSVVVVVVDVIPNLLSIFLCAYVLFLIGRRFLKCVDSSINNQ